MDKFKIILSIFFLVLGLTCAILTYTLDTYMSSFRDYSGTSYNDGVAIGLGIISGFSFLSSVLLLNSISKNKSV